MAIQIGKPRSIQLALKPQSEQQDEAPCLAVRSPGYLSPNSRTGTYSPGTPVYELNPAIQKQSMHSV